ncbi:MAG: 3-deoxy-D-manno-octulosonic acid transferase, partial [Longimicrobiales bacterium]
MYETAQRITRPAAQALMPATGKVGRGLRARRGVVQRLTSWARDHRDATLPLVWVHAPSVGEALMGQAIVGALRDDDTRVQVVFTHFSPSAERVAARVGADVTDYLPWDTGPDVRAVLAALTPAVIAFVRTEIWPVVTREAERAGVRLALLYAVLVSGSSRTGRIARRLLRPGYRRLDAIGAVSAADAARFGALGVPPERVHVTGDARFDQVNLRVRDIDRTSPLLRTLADPTAVTMVAGSTWPRDDELLIPAFAAIRASGGVRLIIAPHEPTPLHLEQLERRIAVHGVAARRLSSIESRDARPAEVIIVDRVGVLADLYVLADFAYVGGGFGGAGLHSVVEPAALGKPVMFGPRHGNAREADELVAEGGAVVVRNGGEMLATLSRLAARPEDR